MNFLLSHPKEVCITSKTPSGLSKTLVHNKENIFNQVLHYIYDLCPHFLFYSSEKGHFMTKRILKDSSSEIVDQGRFDVGWNWYSFQLNEKSYFLKYNLAKEQIKWIEFGEKTYKVMKTNAWKEEISLVVPFSHDKESQFLFYSKKTGKGSIQRLRNGFSLELVHELSLPKYIDQILYLGNHFYCYSIKTGLFINLKFKENEPIMNINFTEAGLYLFTYMNELYSYDSTTGKTKNENKLESFTLPKDLTEILPFENQDYINVMSFNILNSAYIYENGIESVAEIIKLHKIDILGMQEMRDPKAMKKLELILGNEYYYDYDLQMITKFKIIKKYQVNGSTIYGCLLEINENTRVKFFNSHLTAYPYGPYELRDGQSVEKCLEKIQGQTKEVQFAIDEIFFKSDIDYPLIFTGDHNTPSHLDHTLETGSDFNYSRLRNFKSIPIEWPVSKLLQDHGFIDTYRERYSNPLEFPGISWNIGEPNKLIDHNEVFDRIDYIYYKNAKTKFKNLSVYYVDSIYAPFSYPSDHRAVVTRLKILNE